MLIDNHGRAITYLRLAVTDRCNLRCFYCMPHEGINFLPKKQLLTFEEMLRLVRVFAELGINKIRITGGEPFVRKDLMAFLEDLSHIKGINKISITTNGVLTEPYIKDLKRIGVSGINLSLDSLNRERFFEMTRRDELPNVLNTMERILEEEIPLKINAVVMAGKNEDDILELVELGRDKNIGVRFIEEMPFNGEGAKPEYFLSYKHILDKITTKYPATFKVQDESNSTSYNYQIPGFLGTFGLIAAYSRTFCGTCNRVRLTPTGEFKTCLYDDGEFSLRDLIRTETSDEDLKEIIKAKLGTRAKDGFEAEKNRTRAVSESMTTIGG